MQTGRNINQVNANFWLTNLILSMKGTFTLDDVCKEVKRYQLDIHVNYIKKAIVRLRENGYLEETGCTYRCIPKEQSLRW